MKKWIKKGDLYPHWVCLDCVFGRCRGRKNGQGVSTWHQGKCDVCGETKFVTEARDFGYPEFHMEIKK